MASIAYITDGTMIEFHRLNGHRTMNFWRPTTTKKFADFHQGELLFFLAKGTERGKAKEKGIVGFGKLVKAQTMSFSKMWNRYGIENGYASKEELYDAIIKVSKTGKMPKTMNCLYLDDVTFFQVPIYLSEIGIKLSKQTESYIYLDKEDPSATAKILKIAQNTSGLDIWTMAMQGSVSQDIILKEEVRHQLSVIAQKCELSLYTEKEKRMLKRLGKEFIRTETEQGRPAEFIKGSLLEIAKIQKDQVDVIFPFAASLKDSAQKKQTLIGHVWCFNEAAKECSFPLALKYHVLMMEPDEKIAQALCKLSNANQEDQQSTEKG